jgi:GntR family transcriptional regulator, transcriptional repressor for pyruvate dehydrogenase complex
VVASQSDGLAPVRRSRLYEGIVDQLQALIAEGRLKPGDQLPPERVLAETFQVSRTSVREALRALELRGLIEGRQGGGTFVRSVSVEELARPMAAALLAGKREVAELFELREMIEPAIARKAAERARPEHLAELERILEQQRAKVARGEPYPDEDAAFHYTVAVAADNAALLRLVNVIMDLLRESRSTYLQSGDRPRRSLEGHRRLLEALRAHDPGRAERIMREHIGSVSEGVLSKGQA